MSIFFPPSGGFFGSGFMPNRRMGNMPNVTPGTMPNRRLGAMPNVTPGTMPNIPVGAMPNQSTGWMPNEGGQMPNRRRGAVWMPNDPPGSSEMPNDPWRPRSLSVHPLTASPWPWQGSDPGWTFADDEALLAQGLRKARARIVKPSDPRLETLAAVNKVKPRDPYDPLWRWGSEFRVSALVAEMLGAYRVNGQQVWQLDLAVKKGKGSASAQLLFELKLPGTAQGDYDEQVDKVLRAAIEREDRMPEILSQYEDIRAYFALLTPWAQWDTPLVDEVFEVAWQWSRHLVMGLKNNIAALRPLQRSALVMPVVPTPAHGALPSGHATMAKLTADLLMALQPGMSQTRRHQLDAMARRIAFNRTVAGVHYPIDNRAGYELGAQMAKVFVAAATRGASIECLECALDGKSELREDEVASLTSTRTGDTKAVHLTNLDKLWRAAQAELATVLP